MLLITILLAVLILNPYTLIGPLAYYIAAPIVFYVLATSLRLINGNVVISILLCVCISVVGVLSSVVNDIPQFEHFKVSLQLLVYYFCGVGVFKLANKYQIGFDQFVASIAYVICLNSAIILVQVVYPPFRDFVEAFFVSSGNVDWTDGFKYRGIASGGGASLSILTPIGFYFLLYLYDRKQIGLYLFLLLALLLVVSVFFVGRTGILLIPLALLLHAFTKGKDAFRKVFFYVFLCSIVVYFGFDFLKAFLISQYGEDFFRYTLGYFLEGQEGFEDEGTVKVLSGFLLVLPTTFPEVLFGHGFYGGSDFEPWTDSGYPRMFLSVGYIFGIAYYGLVFNIVKRSMSNFSNIFIPVIIMLLLAEFKEPLLLSGYASRVFFILIGFSSASMALDRFVKYSR